ncbi:hypothetical protein [Pseudomonas baltica]|nr:hypothetical protein [Pseudomonas baltica]
MADSVPDFSNGEGDYNFIYTKLMDNENDVIGVVAYSVSAGSEITEAG